MKVMLVTIIMAAVICSVGDGVNGQHIAFKQHITAAAPTPMIDTTAITTSIESTHTPAAVITTAAAIDMSSPIHVGDIPFCFGSDTYNVNEASGRYGID